MAAAAIVVLIPAQASAQQVRIGTNLEARTATANHDCTRTPVTFLPSGVDNCSYLSTVVGAESTASPFQAGLVTSVRVKAAAPTGPMRVTIARAIANTSVGLACCFYQGQSQVFTPAPNTTTTVPVRLPVQSFLSVAEQAQIVDYLALSILQPGVAIPGEVQPLGSLSGSFAYFPSLVPADRISGRVGGFGNNVVPLLSADVSPLCGATGAAGSAKLPEDSSLPEPRALSSAEARQSAGSCVGAVTPRAGSLSGSRVKLPLDCNFGAGCTGKLQLLSRKGGTKLGDTRFALESGERSTAKVKLSKAGKRAAKGKKKLKVKTKAKVTGAETSTKTVKLSR